MLSKRQLLSKREFRGSSLVVNSMCSARKVLCSDSSCPQTRFQSNRVLPAPEEKDSIVGIYGWYCLMVLSSEMSDQNQEYSDVASMETAQK